MRLVTINTAKSDAPYFRRLQLLAQGLAALRPHVVLLQEAFVDAADRRTHTAEYLGAHLGMAVAYQPARCKVRPLEGRETLSESGMAVLSRLPLEEVCAVPLPTLPADGDRVAQLVVVRTAAGPVLLANLHLTFLPGEFELRRTELQTVLEHPLFLRSGYAARLLAGDFNTTRLQLPDLLEAAAGWDVCDAFLSGGGNESDATFLSHRPPAEGRCLDYVVSVARWHQLQPRFADAAVVLAEPDEASGAFLSDHRGLLVRMVYGQSRVTPTR